MWRLKMLKNSARKSKVAYSPQSRVFLPKERSSLRVPKNRAPERERGSFPNVNGAGIENAFAFQNEVVLGLKLELLLVSATPGITLTRAAPVKWQPANKTSPAVPPHELYTSVGCPDAYIKIPDEYHPPRNAPETPPPLRYFLHGPSGNS